MTTPKEEPPAPRFRCCACCAHAVRPEAKLLACGCGLRQAHGAIAVSVYQVCDRFQAAAASPESEGR